MKTPCIIFLLAAALFNATAAAAANPEIEAAYIAASSQRAPFVEVADEKLISFEHDVNGDGSVEYFMTREGMRDGKQGYLWTLYSSASNGEVSQLGEATFSELMFAPGRWAKNGKIQGFYSYGPGGAGKGILNFYTVDQGKVVLLEERRIEPNGADKTEFDSLFAARLTGKGPKINLKRTALSKQPEQLGSTMPGDVGNAPPEKKAATLDTKPAMADSSQPKGASAAKSTPPTAGDKPASTMLWPVAAVAVVAALGLLWLLAKRRK